MQFAYIPIGVPTFDLEVAGDQFEKSCTLMRDCFGSEAVCPDKMLLSIADLKAFLAKTWELGDQWLNEHFTPKNINHQFNTIYVYIKSGKKIVVGM